MIKKPVADLCDDHPGQVRILRRQFRMFTNVHAFAGPVRLIELTGPDGFLADILNTEGNGAIALVNLISQDHPAVFGDGMAQNAEANGWAGVVIDGPLRDVSLIRPRQIGIAATSVVPFIQRNGEPGREVNAAVMAGANVRSGDWLVADEDGIIAIPSGLADTLNSA